VTVTEVSLVSWAKRRGVRQQVLEAAELALAQKLPDMQRLILKSRLGNFVKSFDAIDDGAQDDVWRAIEEAFHLGKHAMLIKVVTEKEIGRANTKIMQDKRAGMPKEPNLVREAVRAAMKMNPRTTSSPESVRKIQAEVTKTLGRTELVPISTLQKYVKEDRREKKIDKVY
jgi:hypothetical protein